MVQIPLEKGSRFDVIERIVWIGALIGAGFSFLAYAQNTFPTFKNLEALDKRLDRIETKIDAFLERTKE